MDLDERLRTLAGLESPGAPVVSLYLDTRWHDEQQRERARVFVTTELRRARRASPPPDAADLEWIEREAAALIAQAAHAGTHGVALFACAALGLRELLTVREPFEEALVVGARPHLRPLADVAERVPPAVVVFVDAERARIIPVDAGGPGAEVALQSEVPGHHRRGGWAQLAQSRYARHIQAHRDQHFAAVAGALAPLMDADGDPRLVLAGEPRGVALFRQSLPAAVARRVAGAISGTRHDPASVLAERAAALLARVEADAEARTLEDVFTEAAKGGHAVVGLQETLEALVRGAVHRLYVLKTFRATGAACEHCGALSPARLAACPICGRPAVEVELGETMIQRALAAGARVETVGEHRALAARDGVAAWLRYPL